MSRSRKTPTPPRHGSAAGAVMVSRDEETAAERAERIESLRRQVEDGTYVPDPYEIARKILDEGL